MQQLVYGASHEINNPLAAAMGFVEMEIEMNGGNKIILRIQKSLQKISNIVKEIRKLSDDNPKVIYEEYTNGSKVVKLSS